jgi:hypothetical protein
VCTFCKREVREGGGDQGELINRELWEVREVLVATFSPLAAIFGPCVVRVRPRALLPGDTEFGGPPQAAARGGTLRTTSAG